MKSLVDKIINNNLQANNFIAAIDLQEGAYNIKNVQFKLYLKQAV